MHAAIGTFLMGRDCDDDVILTLTAMAVVVMVVCTTMSAVIVMVSPAVGSTIKGKA